MIEPADGVHLFLVSLQTAQLARSRHDGAAQRVAELRKDGPAGDAKLLEGALAVLEARRCEYDGARADLRGVLKRVGRAE